MERTSKQKVGAHIIHIWSCGLSGLLSNFSTHARRIQIGLSVLSGRKNSNLWPTCAPSLLQSKCNVIPILKFRFKTQLKLNCFTWVQLDLNWVIRLLSAFTRYEFALTYSTEYNWNPLGSHSVKFEITVTTTFSNQEHCR